MVRKLIFAGQILTAVFLMNGCSDEDVTGCTEPQAPNFEQSASNSCNDCCEKRIEYIVRGDYASVDITYTDRNGNKQQIKGHPDQWTKRINLRVGKNVSLFAQTNSQKGNVRVRIEANNDVFKEKFSSDDFAKAEVQGSVPEYR